MAILHDNGLRLHDREPASFSTAIQQHRPEISEFRLRPLVKQIIENQQSPCCRSRCGWKSVSKT
jgi:hypothetical protein